MKKLMIAAAIVCASALSQAATFDWSTGGDTQYMPTSWTAKKAGDNQESGSSSTKKIQNWVDGGMDFTAAVFLSADGTTWTPSAAESYALDTINSRIGVEDISNSLWPDPMTDKILYYKVVITGTYTDDKGTWTATGTIGGTKDDYIELTAFSADQLDTATVGSWNISFVGADPGPVPEPTSGLLLLLGVAGLALRRRRA